MVSRKEEKAVSYHPNFSQYMKSGASVLGRGSLARLRCGDSSFAPSRRALFARYGQREVQSFSELPKRKIKPRVLSKPRSLDGGDGVCAAYCAKSPISLARVSNFFEGISDPSFTTGAVEIYQPDVVYVPLVVSEEDKPHNAHTFFFSSGAAVFWGVPLGIRRSLLRDVFTLSDISIGSNTHTKDDRRALRKAGVASKGAGDVSMQMEDFDHEFAYRINTKQSRATFRNDEIRLSSFSEPRQLLALSHGLAQSVKLLIHEEAIDLLVLRTRSLPDELATTGRTGMSQRDIKRLIGELLAARYSVNLVSDILDTPEFFWHYPELEKLYVECASAVELRQRAEILETRVQVIKDALDMLNNELSSSSSNRVERAILVLIAVEVCIEVGRLLTHYV